MVRKLSVLMAVLALGAGCNVSSKASGGGTLSGKPTSFESSSLWGAGKWSSSDGTSGDEFTLVLSSGAGACDAQEIRNQSVLQVSLMLQAAQVEDGLPKVGTYSIPGPSAFALSSALDDKCATPGAQIAKSGTVNITRAGSSGELGGSVDISFEDGTSLKSTFEVSNCGAVAANVNLPTGAGNGAREGDCH